MLLSVALTQFKWHCHRSKKFSDFCVVFKKSEEKRTCPCGQVLLLIISAKPRKSRFGIVLPTVDKVVQAIATRDNAQVLPSGMTALNILGLSTQVPMNYTYLTTGSERTVKLANRQVTLKRGVPKNFCYETRLIALLVQALRSLKQENVTDNELQTINSLISKELDKESLMRDVDLMPAWMEWNE